MRGEVRFSGEAGRTVVAVEEAEKEEDGLLGGQLGRLLVLVNISSVSGGKAVMIVPGRRREDVLMRIRGGAEMGRLKEDLGWLIVTVAVGERTGSGSCCG